jgi:hypothetical protein
MYGREVAEKKAKIKEQKDGLEPKRTAGLEMAAEAGRACVR